VQPTCACTYELFISIAKIKPGELSMPNVTISLPDSLRTFVDEQIATKGFGNVSEYFRSLLRDAQQKQEEARLEALLLEGLAMGGKDLPVNRAFWSDLKAEATGLAKKHRKKPA
jgi:antitoxin ParD1/3/4